MHTTLLILLNKFSFLSDGIANFFTMYGQPVDDIDIESTFNQTDVHIEQCSWELDL